MPEPTTKFPSLFTPEDQERMKELAQQRKDLERAYQVKFSDEAWGATSPLERGIRGATPPWIKNIINPLTPGVEPSTEFGFTPEQVNEQSAAVEKEFGDLSRKKRVAELFPTIQSDLMVAALAGKPLTDKSELLATFPELKQDFNEEELNYLARMSQSLAQATPEQILSGELFSSEPNQLPITPEDVESFFKEQGRQDPTKVFATVEFSRSLEGMTRILKDAYPPKTSDEDAAKAMRDKLKLYFQQRSQELGITPDGTTPTNEAIAAYHKKVAKELGTAMTLVDERGNLVPATVKQDNSVWVNNELIGAYDVASKKIVPISPRTGLALPTQAEQESDAKNLWDSFYLGLVEAGHLTKQGTLDILQKLYSLPINFTEAQKVNSQQVLARITQLYNSNEAQHQEWLKDHPELAPKPAWEQSPSEHPELFKDPAYIPYLILSNAPVSAIAAIVGIGTGLVTKSPLAGAVAGAAVMTPLQIDDLKRDLINSGASQELANDLAVPMGTAIGAIEIAPGYLWLKLVTPGFTKMFRRHATKELAKAILINLGTKGILKRAVGFQISEAIEESIQQAMQNATVRTVDDSRAILAGVWDAFLVGNIASFPMTIFGGGMGAYSNMKSNLPPKVQAKIDETATKMQEAGLTEEHAQAAGLAQAMENPIVEVLVQNAVEKVQEQSTQPANIIKMEKQLVAYNQEIDELDQKISNQLDKATKLVKPEDRDLEMSFVDAYNETLEEVEADKTALIKRLEKAREKVGLTPSPVVPEKVTLEVTRIRTDLLPEGWTTKVVEPATGYVSPAAEVDWGNKIIRVLDADIANNPDAMNHEIAHILIAPELKVNRYKVFVDDYMKASGLPISERETGAHGERIAEQLGYYISGKQVSPKLQGFFLKYFPEVAIPKAEAGIKPTVSPEIPVTERGILFHGTDFESAASIGKGVVPGTPYYIEPSSGRKIGNEIGFSLSKDKSVAEAYAQGEEILKFTLSKDAKIALPKDLPTDVFKTIDGEKLFNQSDAVRLAQQKGFDGVDLDAFERLTSNPGRSKEIQIWNPKVLVPVTETKPLVAQGGMLPKGYEDVQVPTGVTEPTGGVTTPEGAVQTPTVASVVFRIVKGERLSIEETQFYNSNMEAVEDALQAQVTAPAEGTEESAEDRAIREEMAASPTPSYAPGEKEALIARIVEGAKIALTRIPSLASSPTQALPKLMDFELEVGIMEKALQDNPVLLRANQTIIEAGARATSTLQGMAELVESMGELSEEELLAKFKKEGKKEGAVKELLDEYKRKGKATGIRWKNLLGKKLDELTPSDQRKVIASFLPDRSIAYQKLDWNFKDTSLVMSDFQRETGMPFSVFYQRTEIIRGYVDRLADRYLTDITTNPDFKHIVGNEKAEERVRLELNSRDPNSGVARPEGITREEIMLADALESVYKEWEPIVRFLRFTEAYEETHNPAKIKKSYIKDAPIEDLQMAKEILETQGEDALWHYLGGKDWGVVKSGYDPRTIHKMKIDFSKPDTSVTRGASYLMGREELAFSGSDRTLMHTFDSYNKSMAIRWFIRGEIKEVVEMLKATKSKWKDPPMINGYIKGYLKEVQGFPPESNPYVQSFIKVRNIVYPIVFAYHWLSARNVVQPLFSFPFRDRLITSLFHFKTLPISFRGEADIFFNTVIDQSGRPIREFLHLNGNADGELRAWQEKAFKPLSLAVNGLEKLARIQGKLSLMSFTDRVSRRWAFNAALDKAYGATEQFRKDQNLEKWFKDSGVSIAYFTPEQQAIIVGYLKQGDKKFSWAIPGLQQVTGYEAANILIAKEIADRTLFMYNAASGGKMHWGSGRIFGSLLIYPRSSVQMVSMQVGKLFSSTSTEGERLTATRHLIMLAIAGELLSSALSGVSGKEKKEYSILSMFSWTLGGLTFGSVLELSTLYNDLVMAGLGTEEDKNRALANLPTVLTRLGDIGIGFYKIAMDITETILDEPSGLDKRWIRKLRAHLDTNYKPVELEKAERTTLEKFHKVFMGTEQADPDALEQALIDTAKAEAKLGSLDMDGSYFTLGRLGGILDTSTKDIPPYRLTSEDGYSDLALFYLQSKQSWEDLYKLPGDPADSKLRGLTTRGKWRLAHPEVEAALIFWEKVDSSVFTRGSKEAKEVAGLLNVWFGQFGVKATAHKRFANWKSGLLIPAFTK